MTKNGHQIFPTSKWNIFPKKTSFENLVCEISFLSPKLGAKSPAMVPQALKIARVTPIFNHGDRFDLGNYTCHVCSAYFSKLLERFTYNRLYDYVLKKNILGL